MLPHFFVRFLAGLKISACDEAKQDLGMSMSRCCFNAPGSTSCFGNLTEQTRTASIVSTWFGVLKVVVENLGDQRQARLFNNPAPLSCQPSRVSPDRDKLELSWARTFYRLRKKSFGLVPKPNAAPLRSWV